MIRPSDLPDHDVLSALPIFPLPNVVLLPGMVLPLNVFEPRYLALVDHVVDHGQHIGVPLLQPGYEADYHGRPPIEAIFGIGRLVSHHRFADGRRMIRLAGLGRVRLVAELAPERPFREVEVAPLAEDAPADLHGLAILRAQLERLAALCPDGGETFRSILAIPDPRIFTYAVSALLPGLELRADEGSVGTCRCQVEVLQSSLAADTCDQRIQFLLERTSAALVQLASDAQPFLLN